MQPQRNDKATDGVQKLDLCAWERPPEEYAGRLVQVEGIVQFGFEESSLTAVDCGIPVWLDFPDDEGHVDDKPTAGSRVILGVTFAQFQEWSKAGALADPSNLPWQTAQPAKPVRPVRDRLWRRLMNAKSDHPTTATLIGRLDYLPGPGFITSTGDSRHPFVWQGSGYGHLDSYPLRLIVTQVVALNYDKGHKKKQNAA